MIEDGLGGTPDLAQAAHWYTLVAQRGEGEFNAATRRDSDMASLTEKQKTKVDSLVPRP